MRRSCSSPDTLVTLHEQALPRALFGALLRRVRSLGRERLAQSYQTTFWSRLGQAPRCVPEAAIPHLLPFVRARFPTRRVVGVEWWLSRMYTSNVQVDFHRDRDEQRALRTGQVRHPRVSSVLFLNRVRGGLLAVTEEPPCEDNPALAPQRLALSLVAPRPNRLALFSGEATHGVLDRENAIPGEGGPAQGRLRLAVIYNWWHYRPLAVPTFDESRAYRSLTLGRRAKA